jgi:hypothetical protein
MAKSGGDITKGWGSLGGASGRMHKFAPTGTQTPDRSSQEGHSGSRRDIKVQSGPSNVMGFSTGVSNKSYAGTQTPGQSAACPTGGNNKFAKGGDTKMFGNRGSLRAEGGKSSP